MGSVCGMQINHSENTCCLSSWLERGRSISSDFAPGPHTSDGAAWTQHQTSPPPVDTHSTQVNWGGWDGMGTDSMRWRNAKPGSYCTSTFSSSSARGWGNMSTSLQLKTTQSSVRETWCSCEKCYSELKQLHGFVYLGVMISLYWSFSTLVVAATDMGMTMLLMSNEFSLLRFLIGCKRKATLSKKKKEKKNMTCCLHYSIIHTYCALTVSHRMHHDYRNHTVMQFKDVPCSQGSKVMHRSSAKWNFGDFFIESEKSLCSPDFTWWSLSWSKQKQ